MDFHLLFWHSAQVEIADLQARKFQVSLKLIVTSEQQCLAACILQPHGLEYHYGGIFYQRRRVFRECPCLTYCRLPVRPGVVPRGLKEQCWQCSSLDGPRHIRASASLTIFNLCCSTSSRKPFCTTQSALDAKAHGCQNFQVCAHHARCARRLHSLAQPSGTAVVG